VTAEQLMTALSQYPPDRRVVVPGQEWGPSDVGEVQSRRLSFYHGADPAWDNWIGRLLRRKDLHREQCVVIGARQSAARRRPAHSVTPANFDRYVRTR
jgi:hypothetical protein